MGEGLWGARRPGPAPPDLRDSETARPACPALPPFLRRGRPSPLCSLGRGSELSGLYSHASKQRIRWAEDGKARGPFFCSKEPLKPELSPQEPHARVTVLS